MLKRENFVTRWLMPLVGALAVGGFSLYWQWPSSDNASHAPDDADEVTTKDHPSTAGIAELYARQDTLADSGVADASATTAKPMASSADYVALHAARNENHVEIALDITKHWHINANLASFDFLIPTEVAIKANGTPLPIELKYPSGRRIDVGLDEPIRVYSGRLVLGANLPEQTSANRLQVEAHVQACNDSGLCLRPSTLSTRQFDPIAQSGADGKRRAWRKRP